jgi:hypothetical protein
VRKATAWRPANKINNQTVPKSNLGFKMFHHRQEHIFLIAGCENVVLNRHTPTLVQLLRRLA